MNAAICILLYGAALTWLCPPILTRLTRSGVSPRLSVAVWLSAIGLAMGAWIVGGAGLVSEVAIGHSPAPVQYCVDMLLAINHLGWPGQFGLGVLSLVAVGISAIVAHRLIRGLQRLRARSREHAHTARLLGFPTARPGVVMLQADEPAAYCVAGRPHAIVVTTGAVATLDAGALAAVLAHEQAHIAGRHPQLMMLLRALAAAMPRLPLFAAAVGAVGRLVEMCADDSAARRHGRDTLLSGLMALAVGPKPIGSALAAADTAVSARVIRLAAPICRVARFRQRILLSATLSVFVAAPAVITLICHT